MLTLDMRCFLKYLLLLFILYSFCSCRVRRTEGVLSPRKMENVLYDYHRAQTLSKSLSYDNRYKRELYIDYVFQKHSITEEEFDASLVWYTRNPKELHKIYEKLYTRIQKDCKTASSRLERTEKKSFSVASGDSVDLWYLRRSQVLTQSPFTNPVVFEIVTDSTFYLSDSLLWTSGVSFITDKKSLAMPQAYISMSLYYGDSISIVDTLLFSNGHFRLGIQCDDGKRLDKIRGAVSYINTTQVENSSSLLVSEMSLLRCHIGNSRSMSVNIQSDTIVYAR